MKSNVIRTSKSHPLIINALKVSNGELGLTFCPGKKQQAAMTGIWDRDIDLDIDVVKSWGADIVISLLEDFEYTELGVPGLPEVFQRNFEWMNLAIPDRHAPDIAWTQDWCLRKANIAKALLNHGKILIHCKGGFGRTGTVAAMILIDHGYSCDDAIELCRKTRELSVETPAQEDFLRSYADQHLDEGACHELA